MALFNNSSNSSGERVSRTYFTNTEWLNDTTNTPLQTKPLIPEKKIIKPLKPTELIREAELMIKTISQNIVELKDEIIEENKPVKEIIMQECKTSENRKNILEVEIIETKETIQENDIIEEKDIIKQNNEPEQVQTLLIKKRKKKNKIKKVPNLVIPLIGQTKSTKNKGSRDRNRKRKALILETIDEKAEFISGLTGGQDLACRLETLPAITEQIGSRIVLADYSAQKINNGKMYNVKNLRFTRYSLDITQPDYEYGLTYVQNTNYRYVGFEMGVSISEPSDHNQYQGVKSRQLSAATIGCPTLINKISLLLQQRLQTAYKNIGYLGKT